MIHLDLPDAEVRRRVLARRLCSALRHGLQPHRPPARPVEGRCDVCGGELVSREDDTEEALEARLREYHGKTDPVLQLLGRKSPLVTVDARADRETVTRHIRAGLRLPAS